MCQKVKEKKKVALQVGLLLLLECIKKKVFCFSYKQEELKLQLDPDSKDGTELGTKIKIKR